MGVGTAAVPKTEWHYRLATPGSRDNEYLLGLDATNMHRTVCFTRLIILVQFCIFRGMGTE